MVKLRLRTYPEDVPVALGSFILCTSKLVMSKFYFDFMKHFFDKSKFQLISMDTDSVSINHP